jgi:hypothetical protein
MGPKVHEPPVCFASGPADLRARRSGEAAQHADEADGRLRRPPLIGASLKRDLPLCKHQLWVSGRRPSAQWVIRARFRSGSHVASLPKIVWGLSVRSVNIGGSGVVIHADE